jgi:hypothetical protein
MRRYETCDKSIAVGSSMPIPAFIRQVNFDPKPVATGFLAVRPRLFSGHYELFVNRAGLRLTVRPNIVILSNSSQRNAYGMLG